MSFPVPYSISTYVDVDRAEADRHDYNTSVQINLHPDLQQFFPVRWDNIQDTEEEEEGAGDEEVTRRFLHKLIE